MNQLNTAFRHQFDYGCGVVKDSDGCYHLAKAIWRLMAQLQLDVESDHARVPPGDRADTARAVPARGGDPDLAGGDGR